VSAIDWPSFLAEWTRAIRARRPPNASRPRTPDPVLGFGAPGATEAQLAAAERRLGTRLPPSYRAFLAATNGLRQPYEYVATTGGDFWPVERVDWFRVRNADWIAAYDGLVEHLDQTLELSHDGDSAVYLLNPAVVGKDGEWEAWHFANWMAGEPARHRSFGALMLDRRAALTEGSNDGF
jgi:hypothetical protein